MPVTKLDLTDWHDLTRRLAVVDTELPLGEAEEEHARCAGLIELIGARSTRVTPEPEHGLVLAGSAVLIVTSERLIVMVSDGRSQLGAVRKEREVHAREAHAFALPWDLVDAVGIPATRSITDRVAGARTIDITSTLVFIHLKLIPADRVEIGGQERRAGDEDVMRLLVGSAARHRLSVSPPEDRARIQGLLAGRYTHSGDEIVAWITSEDTLDIPPHLQGRLVLHGSRSAERAAASLLLLGGS